MELVFGLWADGGAVPDHGGDIGGALGKPVVGPNGLIDILETALGLGGPQHALIVRIASFQATLEKFQGSYFWSRSLQTDPWATAKTLLSWRDELVGLGWRSDLEWAEPRLAQLAHVSHAATDLPPGLSDRAAAIMQVLESAPVSRIRLIDALEVHPSPLRRLIERLRQIGCVVEEIVAVSAAPPDTSLGKLQRWISGAADVIEGVDGTLTIATCSSEPLAAEIVGQWLALQTKPGISIIAQSGDTYLLDHGLANLSQPRAGRSRASVHRGSLQLLLLAFKVSWAPFDPRALMEILIFPNSPIAPRAAWHLAGALEQAPGRGGVEWDQAWAAITAAEQASSEEKSETEDVLAARIDRWRSWAEPIMADPINGMPLSLALVICDRVTTWAARRYAATNDPLYAATVTLSNEVRTALASIGRDMLPRMLVERIIDQALDIGQPNPDAIPQAASWRSTTHPGAIWAPTTAVVWWNFGSTGEGLVRSPWTTAERTELEQAGCPADDVSISARAASSAWERALLNARETVLLVAGGLDCQHDDQLHALSHRIKPAFDKVGARLRLETCLSSTGIVVAGTAISRLPIAPKQLPVPRYSWPTPDSFQSTLEQITESATSLEGLFSCQLMWALKHVARLRPGRVRSIPDANQLLGNLAHAIAREIFQPGAPPNPENASQLTNTLLEERIDQLAAPLRHPEFAEQLNTARRRLPAAMASLAKCLTDNQLTVEATELQVSGRFETALALRGAVDLVARDQNNHVVIIDLKWTRSDKTRVDELTQGKAVQLATYGALVSGGEPYRAGYFLLNQKQFLTLKGSGLIGRSVESVRTFPETWNAIISDWDIWRQTAVAGEILATGIPDVADNLPENLGIVREVRCEWCDYSTLCRVKMG